MVVQLIFLSYFLLVFYGYIIHIINKKLGYEQSLYNYLNRKLYKNRNYKKINEYILIIRYFLLPVSLFYSLFDMFYCSCIKN